MAVMHGFLPHYTVTSHLCSMAGFKHFPEGMRHVHQLRVRYADTDRMDMVYHGTYAAYLEAARVEMLRDAGWVYAELEKAGVLLPVVQLNLTYKRPARYDQLLDVRTHVVAEPTTKVVLALRGVPRGRLARHRRCHPRVCGRPIGTPLSPAGGIGRQDA